MDKRATKWHSVTVVLHKTSCGAAALCRNSRFLAKDAPRLPLAACEHPEQCPCTYRHYEDRRKGVRRSADVGGALPSESVAVNRRATRGRRERDKT